MHLNNLVPIAMLRTGVSATGQCRSRARVGNATVEACVGQDGSRGDSRAISVL